MLAALAAFVMTGCDIPGLAGNGSGEEQTCAVWHNGQCMAWINLEGLPGQDGQDGVDGIDGLSAYELAVIGGFEGTEAEWLISLQGAAGVNGDNGVDGSDGVNGLSAYELAVIAGFEGTLEEWLISLVGPIGPEGPQGIPGVCPDCDGNGTICPPIEPPVVCPQLTVCPPELDEGDRDIHFIVWFDRDDMGDYQMQHLIEAGYIPSLAESQSAPITVGEPSGTGVDEPGMKVIDRNGTTIIYSVMPLRDNTLQGSLQHGMGLNFVQEVTEPIIEPTE